MAQPNSILNCRCEQCGIAFHVKPSHLGSAGRYCSRACKYAAMRAAGAASRTTILCQQCGNRMSLLPNRIASGQRFCSTTCAAMARTHNITERFWTKVRKTETCWLWQGGTQSGYGALLRGSKRLGTNRLEGAHRLAWEIASGSPVPAGYEIIHTCDVRNCVRNDEPGSYLVQGVALPRWGHLALGTHAQNLADASAKLRWTPGNHRGERNGRARLTTTDVHLIRTLLAAHVTQRDIAARFGVGESTISRVARREGWAHV